MISSSGNALVLLLVTVNGFNLSPKYAQFIKTPNGDLSNNYFGYTVALQSVSRPDVFNKTLRLIVGAPKANSSVRPQSSIVEPGEVFQCSVTSSLGNCRPIYLETPEQSSSTSFHKRDNAWFGQSIDVQDDSERLLICGPRWTRHKNGHSLMNGCCVWKNETFEKMRPRKKDSDPLWPFENLGKQGIRNANGSDIFYHAQGGAGISAHIITKTMEILIGAPGVYDWTGTVVRYSQQTLLPIVPNPALNKNLQLYDYFGYSVDSGFFLRSTPDKTYYVGGAPRGADLNGLVLIFDFVAEQMQTLIELKGYQLGEYFGSSVCVVDLNNDGLDDLIVGAPLHSVSSCLGSNRHCYDEGRVYVFINNDHKIMTEIGDSNLIIGSSAHGSRFGTSIAKIGDINLDGFNDIAVGAPYEENGKGSIYIYNGQKTGINSTFSQRIAASDFSQPLSGFGISISRGLDVDGNHYNDIAVGAYSSGHAILIKSQPVITFEPRLTSDVRNIAFSATEFTVIACLKYTGKHAPNTVEAFITLDVNAYSDEAIFGSNSTEQKNKTISYLTILTDGNEQCSYIQVQLSKGENLDFTKSIELRMDYRVATWKDKTQNRGVNGDSMTTQLDFCKTCPVVDPSEVLSITKSVPYSTGCRNISVCYTNLVVLTSFENFTSPLILGTQSKLHIEISVKNFGETAFLLKVYVTFSSVTPLARLPPGCQEEDAIDHSSTQHIQLKCDITNPLKTDSETSFILEIDVSGLTAMTEEVVYVVNASSAGEEDNPGDNVQELHLALESVADVSIVGTSSQDKLLYSNTSNTFTHTYEVRNNGPSPVTMVMATFQIPVAFKSKKVKISYLDVYEPTAYLLISRHKHPVPCVISSRGDRFIDDGEGDNRVSTSESLSLLKKRSADNTKIDAGSEMEMHEKLSLTSTVLNYCSNGDMHCMIMSCSIGPFLSPQTTAVIQLRMRTEFKALGDLMHHRNFNVSSTGSVKISNSQVRQPINNKPDDFTVTTVIYVNVSMSEKSAAPWFLASAIVAGLLLLFIIIGILYKVGFFTRSKKEELNTLKKQGELSEKSELGDVLNEDVDDDTEHTN